MRSTLWEIASSGRNSRNAAQDELKKLPAPKKEPEKPPRVVVDVYRGDLTGVGEVQGDDAAAHDGAGEQLPVGVQHARHVPRGADDAGGGDQNPPGLLRPGPPLADPPLAGRLGGQLP